MKKKPKTQKNKLPVKDRILSKFTTGRTKSHNKRKKTLLLEYKLRNKANKFIDRRIGENNKAMTVEDRLMARFAAERVKLHNKKLPKQNANKTVVLDCAVRPKIKAKYNLQDDEVFTHRGQTLQQIEKFEDPRSDDEWDDDPGKLQADFVSEAHFGGGLFSKVSSENSSHHNVIDQLIIESKKRKAERQQDKAVSMELTEKLDKDFNELFPIVSKSQREKDEAVNRKHESYDIIVNELKFEPVGRPSDRVKSETEIESEEKRKLAKLEAERISRMKRTADANSALEGAPRQKKHHSADDLDDDFELDDDLRTKTENDEDGDNDADEDENQVDEDEDEESDDSDDENESDDNSDDGNTEHEEEEETQDRKLSTSKQKSNGPLRMPASYDDLRTIFASDSVTDQVEIIKQIIEKHHPSAGYSKQNLMTIFPIILKHIDKLAKIKKMDCCIFMEKMCPLLFDLTQMCPDMAATYCSEALKEKHDRFKEHAEQRVSLDTILFLKLIPLLFPASDYYHPVTTPATAFLCQILSQQRYNTVSDISSGLFCATITLEFIELSKRYCPEVVEFLKDVLISAIPSSKRQAVPASLFLQNSKLLELSDNCKLKKIGESELKLKFDDLVHRKTDADDNYKVRALNVALKLTSKFVDHSSELVAAYAIWSPFLKILKCLQIDKFPDSVKSECERLKSSIDMLFKKKLSMLTGETKKTKILRLYEPNIRPITDRKAFRTISEAKLEREKLMHQYKKELKGAMKEIRKDRNFIARVKFAEQDKKDAERRAKVKQIYSWGESQQSELKRMERQNKFKRK